MGVRRRVLSVALAHFPNEPSSSSDTAWGARTVEDCLVKPPCDAVDCILLDEETSSITHRCCLCSGLLLFLKSVVLLSVSREGIGLMFVIRMIIA